MFLFIMMCYRRRKADSKKQVMYYVSVLCEWEEMVFSDNSIIITMMMELVVMNTFWQELVSSVMMFLYSVITEFLVWERSVRELVSGQELVSEESSSLSSHVNCLGIQEFLKSMHICYLWHTTGSMFSSSEEEETTSIDPSCLTCPHCMTPLSGWPVMRIT